MPRIVLYLNNDESVGYAAIPSGLKEVEKEMDLEAVPREGEEVWVKGYGDPLYVSVVSHRLDLGDERTVVQVLLGSVRTEDLEEILAADPSWRSARH